MSIKTHPEILIFPIHHSGHKIVLAVTGGGTEVIGELLRFGGGSHTLLEAIVPYDNASFCSFIQGKPDKFCSAAAARQMAMASFQRALSLKPEGFDVDKLYGIGVTASLCKFKEREGRRNHFYIAFQSSKATFSYSVDISPEAKLGRVQQEKLVCDYIISLLYMHFCEKNISPDLQCQLNDFLKSNCKINKAFSSYNESQISKLLTEQQMFCNITNNNNGTEGRVIFPGSFNPFHEGHFAIVNKVAALTGKKVDLEISVKNVDKPMMDYIEIGKRIESIKKFNNEFVNDIFLTKLPTFSKKAQHFKNTTFVVGWDTFVRISDPKYGNLNQVLDSFHDNDINFLVFHRIMDGVKSWEQPFESNYARSRLLKISKVIDPAEFVSADISSSAIRKQSNGD